MCSLDLLPKKPAYGSLISLLAYYYDYYYYYYFILFLQF